MINPSIASTAALVMGLLTPMTSDTAAATLSTRSSSAWLLRSIDRTLDTAFTLSLEGIKHVKSEDGEILTKPFLEVCQHLIPAIDKLGASMATVKSDIGGNISRLDSKYSSDPAKYNLLYTMIKEEVEAKTAKGAGSCTNGLVWLTRAMDFILALFQNLIEHANWSMYQCCTDSYSRTIKKWHGWLATTSVTVAMKLAPDRTKLMGVLGNADAVKVDIEKFLAAFPPILAENHKFLENVGMDNLRVS